MGRWCTVVLARSGKPLWQQVCRLAWELERIPPWRPAWEPACTLVWERSDTEEESKTLFLFLLTLFDMNFRLKLVLENLLVLVALAWEYSGIPGEESAWEPAGIPPLEHQCTLREEPEH